MNQMVYAFDIEKSISFEYVSNLAPYECRYWSASCAFSEAEQF